MSFKNRTRTISQFLLTGLFLASLPLVISPSAANAAQSNFSEFTPQSKFSKVVISKRTPTLISLKVTIPAYAKRTVSVVKYETQSKATSPGASQKVISGATFASLKGKKSGLAKITLSRTGRYSGFLKTYLTPNQRILVVYNNQVVGAAALTSATPTPSPTSSPARTLTLDPNDGVNVLESMSVTSLGVTLPVPMVSRLGYTFTYWSTSQSDTATTYSAGSTFAYPSEDITLYAQWGANTFTVSIDGDGATSGAMQVELIHFGDIIPFNIYS